MASLTSQLRVTMKDDVSGPAKAAAAALKGVGASAKDLDKLSKIDAFRATQKSFAASRVDFRVAQDNVRKLSREMSAAEAPTKKLEAAYKAAQQAAKSTSDAFRQQASAIKASMSALNGAGVPLSKLVSEENKLRAAIERTTSAASKRNSVVAPRNDRVLSRMGAGIGAVAAPIATAVTAQKAKDFTKKAVVSSAEFDIGTLKQQAFMSIPKDVQDRVLIPQAKRIGQDTQFSNLDVIKAQTKAMTSLPNSMDANERAEIGAGIVDSVKNYAMTLEADLEGSSEAIRTFLQTTGKDISTKEKAIAQATRATNLMVKMAKLGGMNDEDVQQYMKFGAGTATAAGLSDTTLAALGATGRKGGLRGDELGVFTRAISSKLVSPTSKGLDALSAAGIDFNKFTTMPGGLSTDNLEALQKRRFGKGINDDQRGRLNDLLENSEVVSNRDEFTKQVSDILAESFSKKKNGETKAQDAQKIAKMVGDFHKLSTESVDSEGLLNAIMTNPKMSIALLNAMFTDKHGGKGSILASKWGDFKESKKELDHVADDPTFAKTMADKIMSNIGGDWERAKGSVENFTLAVGQAIEPLSRLALKATGDTLDTASNLPDKVLGYGAGVALATGTLVSGVMAKAVATKIGLVATGTGAGGVAGGIGIGALAGVALSDISKDFIKANPDVARALTGNMMLGAMNPDAALAAGILYPGSTPGRYETLGSKSRAGSTERRGAWIPGQGPDVFTTGTQAYDKGSPPPATKPSPASDGVFKNGVKGVEGLNQSSEASAAAAATIASYQATATASLAAVDPIFAAAVARWNGILGGVTSSVTVTPKFGPAPAVGKGATLGSGSKHAAFADYGFDTA